jgi:hypothetical protein
MRLLADENFPGAGATALRRLGHDVSWIGEVMRGASDIAVLDLATRERRIILTFDKDFGELARKSKLPDTCGVISSFERRSRRPPPKLRNASQGLSWRAKTGRDTSASSSPDAFVCED